ncbi:hypothetical protein RchiOBHm_Chr5g0022341 [Rosa chinensis]|uniref:Uncharacterized protein n=1 Tax=Rosa chinensis TaxID=74649 RepID=A0A2P6Q7S2_ROSCH|nr:hypothetical protein RchiOBHm_Chr5g0022341 [Rosa chinensis]
MLSLTAPSLLSSLSSHLNSKPRLCQPYFSSTITEQIHPHVNHFLKQTQRNLFLSLVRSCWYSKCRFHRSL